MNSLLLQTSPFLPVTKTLYKLQLISIHLSSMYARIRAVFIVDSDIADQLLSLRQS